MRAVAVLALPATDQVEWLGTLAPGSPVGCDELALEFDDGWRLLPQFISNGWLNEAVGEAAQQIDQLLSETSKSANALEWTTASLASSARWASVRQLARSLLAVI
jgi:hypothetical protein